MTLLYDERAGRHYLLKQPQDSRLYAMDFAALLGSDTIASVQSVTSEAEGRVGGASALTLGAASVNGSKVEVRIDGGTHGENYKLTIVVQTAGGDTLEGDGWLYVRDI